jgi:uncharacterized membrane protein YhaH (DUF805 family)
MDTFWNAIAKGFKNYFRFSGSSSRSEFWYFTLFWFLAYVIVGLVDHAMLTPVVNLRELSFGEYIPLGRIDPEVGLLTLLFRPVMMIPTLSVTVRRLHDVGKSGWYVLLWVLPVPVLGWLWLIPLLIKPSQYSSIEEPTSAAT